jgi:hypothetical protein
MSQANPGTTTRRTVLTGIASVPATLAVASTLAAGTAVASATVAAAIDRYKKADAESERAYDLWDEAESAAGKKIGQRPTPMIRWRSFYIGEGEIEQTRDTLLERGLDRNEIEAEYRDAKARYRLQVKKGNAWDRDAGITDMTDRWHQAYSEAEAAKESLLSVSISSTADAAALLAVACSNLGNGTVLDDWEVEMLANVNAYFQGGQI